MRAKPFCSVAAVAIVVGLSSSAFAAEMVATPGVFYVGGPSPQMGPGGAGTEIGFNSANTHQIDSWTWEIFHPSYNEWVPFTATAL